MSPLARTKTLKRLAIVSTVIDAGVAIARKDFRAGALLLGAAIVSSRVPGLGVVASALVRLYRRSR
jgi:hypothetical protein